MAASSPWVFGELVLTGVAGLAVVLAVLAVVAVVLHRGPPSVLARAVVSPAVPERSPLTDRPVASDSMEAALFDRWARGEIEAEAYYRVLARLNPEHR